MSALPDDFGSGEVEEGWGRCDAKRQRAKHTHHMTQYKKTRKDVWRVEIGKLTGGEFLNVSDQP